MVTESRNEKEVREFSRKSPHVVLIEFIYKKKIEEIIVDVLTNSQGHLGATANTISEKAGINISLPTFSRWIDKFGLRGEVERIRDGFGRATSANLVESGVFSSERIMRAIAGGLCTSCNKSYEDLITPVKVTAISKSKGQYIKEDSLSVSVHDRKHVAHFFILDKNIVKEMIDEL